MVKGVSEPSVWAMPMAIAVLPVPVPAATKQEEEEEEEDTIVFPVCVRVCVRSLEITANARIQEKEI